MAPHLNERRRRLFAVADAKAAGYGRIADHGIAASTIGRRLKEFGAPPPVEPGRVRRPGGGRKALGSIDPKLLENLNALVEPDANAETGLAALFAGFYPRPFADNRCSRH